MPIEMPPQSSELLAIQGRAIARRQGAKAGMDPRAMRGQVSNGRWQRLQWGVYAAFSGVPARETILWAALLRAGPDAVLSHQTAAERHGLIDEPGSLITISVPASKRPARAKIPGLVIHRSATATSTTCTKNTAFARNSMGPQRIPPMSSGAINAAIMPTRSGA